MTVDVQRLLRLPALSSRRALPLARGLAAGLLLMVGACSDTSTPPATYTIGGAVSGLSGTGLVLANGATTLSVATGATSFLFPTAVAAGTAYSVVVQASPTGLTCSVAGGAGTLQTANVNSIAVTCATASYMIGGSVSGLSAAGLILQNGSDMVAVASGATSYTLPTAVAPTSSYNVTVQAEPTGSVYCSVANGSGTVPTHSVTNANVSCSSQPFTVGGSITGLNGPGLVLANGSSTLTLPANATSFAIPVAFKSTFAVTVQTQPAGITCAVSAGSGTMPASNVSTVIVTCADHTYNLTGTITGLTTSGLVLANGSATSTVASGATGYSFTVPFGSPYSVTVHTQPSGLTCSVANATGTMPANDQSGVNVTCAVNSYSVGGSITNLHGTGLVLANGTDTLTVPSNATRFTMPQSVAFGASYTITIQTQPRGSVCTVSNGGPASMGAANVTSVTVACIQNAVWAYSPDYNNGVILMYEVDNSTHALTLSSTTYPAGGSSTSAPIFVAVNAASNVLYVVNRYVNSVQWFSIDPTTGALTSVNTIATGGFTPQMIAFNPAGTLAFVPNSGNDKISVYSIDSSGNLTAVSGSPFTVVTTHPVGNGPAYAAPRSIAVHPTLNQIYVTNYNSGEVATFSFDPVTGLLTQGTSLQAGQNPNGIVVDPAGAYAYASDQYYEGGAVLEFSINSSGVLSLISTGPNTYAYAQPPSGGNSAQPFGIAIDPTGQFVYTANNATPTDGAWEFTVDPNTHLLNSTGVVTTGHDSSTVLVDPITDLVYVVNNATSTTSVSIFSADASTGALSVIGTASGVSGSAQNSIAFANP